MAIFERLSDEGGQITLGWAAERVFYVRFEGTISVVLSERCSTSWAYKRARLVSASSPWLKANRMARRIGAATAITTAMSAMAVAEVLFKAVPFGRLV